MKNALVIIDVQNGFINENTANIPDSILNYVNSNHFDTIITTAYVNNKNTACYIFEHWKECMEGTEDAKVVKQLSDISDITFNKSKYSFWNKEFIEYIRSNNIDRLYLCGVNTGCCVLHSAFDAYNDLQDIVVVEDLCGSSNGQSSHNAGIQVLQECITKQRVIKSYMGILPDDYFEVKT